MNAIINASWGEGYKRGQKRLVESVRSFGFKGDILTWADKKINEHHDVNHPYTMKAAAFYEAKQAGYKNVLWMDCSIIAIKPLDELFNLIETDGFYFWKSGWKLSNSATDRDLEIGGYLRDDADTLSECASGIVGLNFSSPRAEMIYERFMNYNGLGVCSTSRLHAGQSSDPRFYWGRQDQTAFTMAFHKASRALNEEWTMYDHNVYSAYYEKGMTYNDSVALLVKGGDFR